MALSRTAKIWIYVISIPVGILLLAIIGLKLYLTGDRLKGMIIPRVEQATHRTVTVRDVSFSILPSFSIQIEGLSISNKAGSTFSRNDFLSVERIDLNVKILELLNNRLDISHLVIEKPKMYLEVTPDGLTNYSDETEETGKDTKVNAESDASGTFLLTNFDVRNALLEFYDHNGDTRTIIEGYNQTASITKAEGKHDLILQAEASIAKLSFGTITSLWLKEVPVKATGTLTFQPAGQVLTLNDVKMVMGELPASATGTISDLMGTRTFDLTITASNATLKQVLSLIPPEMLKAAQGLSSSGDVQAVVTMKGESTDDIQPEVSGTFTIANGTVHYTSLAKSITKINLNGSFVRPAGERKNPPAGKFQLSTLSATLGTNSISGNLSMIDFNDPAVTASFNGNVNLNEVKEYYPLEQGTTLSGAMKGNLALAGNAKEPTSIKASGLIDFQDATIKTASSTSPVQNLNGSIAFNNQNIESKKLSMTMGESDLALAFTVKNYLGMIMKDAAKAGKPTATVSLTSKQLRTADLMSEPKEEATGKKTTEPKQAMMLPGVDVDANVNIGKLVTEKFTFTDAKGSLALRDGIVDLKNFSVNAFDGSIATKGVLDLRDAKKRPFNLDLNIKNVQSNAMLSKFTSFGNNIFGKLSMATNIKGELDDTLGFIKQALGGDGTVQVTDGSLKGYAVMASVAALTGLNELREVGFDNWSNVFSIADGKVNIRDLKVKGGSTDFLVNGSEGLDGSLDYTLNVKLPGSVSNRLKLNGVADNLMQFFKDSDGRISLSFLVGGMHTSPSLKLDTRPQEEMAKKAVQQKIDEGQKKVESEIQKKLGEGLNNLFKKKK